MMMNSSLERLESILADRPSVLILPHNDPDPDAIASAVGLDYLLRERFSIQAKIAYRGHIGRAENKALAQYLNNPLRHLRDADLLAADKIALVDTQPGTGNNPLPSARTADIVIDHHNYRPTSAESALADVRPELGASSTILTEYLQEAGLDPPSSIATALFYGIKTDTMGLSRKADPADVSAYFYLQSKIDVNALVQIEQAQVLPEYYRWIDDALHAVRIYADDVLIVYLGTLPYPDLSAEIADFFLRLKGIQLVLSMGFYENELILSVRSRNKKIGADKLVQDLLKGRGTAGGHGVMAAGHLYIRPGESPDVLAAELEKQAVVYLKKTEDIPWKALI
jgi:nanoRNase/pAp phosphatase (c-di-AMP/oligoRNAs hydrolase)